MPAGQCFRENEIRGWVAPDPSTLYLRVQTNRIVRIALARQCSALRNPSAHLITKSFGDGLICAPVDMNLSVSDMGIAEPCFVQTITPLTADQAALLPKGARP
jgi:hypothetical protein